MDNIMYQLGCVMVPRSVVKHYFGFFCVDFWLRLIFKSVGGHGGGWRTAESRGQGQGFLGSSETAMGPIFQGSQEFVMIVATGPTATTQAAMSSFWTSSSSPWTRLISSMLQPRPGLGPGCFVPLPNSSCCCCLPIHSCASCIVDRWCRNQVVQHSGLMGYQSLWELVHSLRTTGECTARRLAFISTVYKKTC